METEGTLRARKKARTRDAIADTALRLFLAQGFEATTIDQIADAAEVGRRTFFRYFPSKEAVVYPRYQERLERFRALLAAPEPDDAAFARVRRACLTLAADYLRDREELAAQQRVIDASPTLIAHERTLDQAWEAAIAAALAAPRRPDRGARVRAGAIMGAIRATLRDWFAAGARDDLVRRGEEALSLLARGIDDDAPSAPAARPEGGLAASPGRPGHPPSSRSPKEKNR